MRTTMTDNTDMQAILRDAMRIIAESADELKAGCAIGDEWPDAEDKAEYDQHVAVLESVRALAARDALAERGATKPIEAVAWVWCGTIHEEHCCLSDADAIEDGWIPLIYGEAKAAAPQAQGVIARKCSTCQGGELLPQYGCAPHDCFYKLGKGIGQSEVHAAETWPENFEIDEESGGQSGTFHCPVCGPKFKAGKPVAAPSREQAGEAETEQSIAADCYHWIAERIGTKNGHSVQEHVDLMCQVLQNCSDYFHDFVDTDEGGDNEAVRIAADLRAVLNGRLEDASPSRECGDAVVWETTHKAVCVPLTNDASLAVEGKPTETGIYAWIAEGSASLVHAHKRPTDHSPGNVLNGSLIRNCAFYDGCAIEKWIGGTWYGPLKHPGAPVAAPQPSQPSLSEVVLELRRKIADAPRRQFESAPRIYTHWLSQDAVLDILDARLRRALLRTDTGGKDGQDT